MTGLAHMSIIMSWEQDAYQVLGRQNNCHCRGDKINIPINYNLKLKVLKVYMWKQLEKQIISYDRSDIFNRPKYK